MTLSAFLDLAYIFSQVETQGLGSGVFGILNRSMGMKGYGGSMNRVGYLRNKVPR